MVNFGPLAAEIGPVVWDTPANFNGFHVWQRYCSDVAQPKPTKLCTVFGRYLGWYTTYIFGGSCPIPEFCQVHNSPCIQVLPSRILAASLHGTPAAGVSQTLRR